MNKDFNFRNVLKKRGPNPCLWFFNQTTRSIFYSMKTWGHSRSQHVPCRYSMSQKYRETRIPWLVPRYRNTIVILKNIGILLNCARCITNTRMWWRIMHSTSDERSESRVLCIILHHMRVLVIHLKQFTSICITFTLLNKQNLNLIHHHPW